MSFEVKFSPVVIKHLGIQMYSTLPPVLAELITNSYDADATEVIITIDQYEKSIEIIDDGCGMNEEELNNEFLKIGRNRRSNKPSTSPKFCRAVTGKKGLGKLSVFGICKSVYVESCKDNLVNAFELDYATLLNQGEKNEPLELKALIDNKYSGKNSYTKIILKDLTRKSKIPVLNTANSLLNRLNIFSTDFKVEIKDGKDTATLTNDERNKVIYKDEQFFWKFPDDLDKLKVDIHTKQYFIDNDINGKIFTTKFTLNESLIGVTLFARKKLANSPSFFGTKTSNNHAYSYMAGELHVDFIDDDNEDDNISTARNSLIWENDSMIELQSKLETVLKKIATQWKDLRRGIKAKEITDTQKFNLEWFESNINSKHEKALAKKITNLVMDSDLEIQQSIDLLKYVESAFEFDTFVDFARELEDSSDTEKLLKLLKDWEVIEAKEHYRLALGRVETIEKFDKLIKSNTLEVAKAGIVTMHSFLNKFPWILEPRLSSFDDEVTYKKFLEDEFDDTSELEEDRRIDFLCKGSTDILYVIEIKRSQKIIDEKDMNQLKAYQRFLEVKLEENDRGYTTVKAYIIGKEASKDKFAQKEIKEGNAHNRFVLNYNQMLSQARKYHQDFIQAYERTNSLNKLVSTN